MKHTLIVSVAACVLIVSMLACNAPASPSNSQPDYVATITAQAALIGQPTGTPASSEATATSPSQVLASVSAATNCRSGPGAAYSLIASLSAGQELVVVGKDTADDYWIVDTPGGPGTCWLWGQYSAVTGDISVLPPVSPPALTVKATKTPKPTAAPAAAQGALPLAPHSFDEGNTGLKSCTTTATRLGGYNIVYDVSIEWVDADATIQGYRVYQGSSLLATLPASITRYKGSGKVTGNGSAGSIPFAVEAFNAAGSSPAYLTLTCP